MRICFEGNRQKYYQRCKSKIQSDNANNACKEQSKFNFKLQNCDISQFLMLASSPASIFANICANCDKYANCAISVWRHLQIYRDFLCSFPASLAAGERGELLEQENWNRLVSERQTLAARKFQVLWLWLNFKKIVSQLIKLKTAELGSTFCPVVLFNDQKRSALPW